ncbi:MAG: carbohydrate ABC transporter permease [Sphaerochaetaceae bacterium]|nr:carbohydrate ABC transporter permease [Sphaerochaetaceae bacterium]
MKDAWKKSPLKKIALVVFCLTLAVVILYPYFVMFTTAAKPNDELYSNDMSILPRTWHLNNFIEIWKKAPVAKFFVNSVAVALGSTLLAIACGIPAAYSLARMKFKGKGIFLGLIIMSQMFAPVVLLPGIYKLMVNLHTTDSLAGLILLNTAFNQAFAIWLLRGTFLSISPEMEQAAKIDGCNRMQAMFRILLPMAAPGIVTALIFIFINAWNEYTMAMTLISSEAVKPITVGINVFYGYNMIQWQYLFATSIFATIPVVILFLFIEKHLVSGLTAGGVKG